MPRRRELKGVAFGVLGSFVSRYNDVEGYWGMGKLCRLALDSRVSRVEIDLLAVSLHPYGEIFHPMIEQYARLLDKQLKVRGLLSAWLKNAKILVDFASSASSAQLFETALQGGAFACAVVLVDDLGKERSAQTSGRCWAHDPTRELRRHKSDWYRLRLGSSS